MTKKAEKIIKTLEEKMYNHTEFYKDNNILDYEFTEKFLIDMYEEFKNMLLGMYRFNLLNEFDLNEMLYKALELYNHNLNRLRTFKEQKTGA